MATLLRGLRGLEAVPRPWRGLSLEPLALGPCEPLGGCELYARIHAGLKGLKRALFAATNLSISVQFRQICTGTVFAHALCPNPVLQLNQQGSKTH